MLFTYYTYDSDNINMVTSDDLQQCSCFGEDRRCMGMGGQVERWNSRGRVLF